MIKILIFIDWYEPGYKAGGPIRSVKNLVERLKGEREVYIITGNSDYQEKDPYKGVKSNCWNETEKQVKIYYASPDRVSFSHFYDLTKEVKPDVVYLNGIYSFYYSILPLLIAKILHSKKIVVSPRGMLAPGAMSVSTGKKKLFLQLAKQLGLYRNIVFHATKEEEKAEIKREAGRKNPIYVISNLPQSEKQLPWKPCLKEEGEVRLAWMGRMAPEKNTLYAFQVLEKSTCGNLVFDLYGAIYDHEYWKDCQRSMERMPEGVRVSYKGSLPNAGVVEKLQSYHFLFLPTRGENFGHVILEALSAGTPVIISDQTPWRNLKKKNIGFDIPLQDPKKFVEVIEALAKMGQEEYNRTSADSYGFAQQILNNTSLVQEYLRLFSVDLESKER